MSKSFRPRSFYIESSPLLLLNIDDYKLQVGGHGMMNNNKYQILTDGKGTLYKPIQYFPKGEKEILFYQKVFDKKCQNSVLLNLKKFIPQYRGLFSCNIPEKEDLYIAIEDLLFSLKHPNVADIKMGRVSFEPDAPEEKKKVESEKYKWRKDIGFLMTGLKIQYPEKQYLDRNYCRSLNVETVYTEGLLRFLGPDVKRAKVLANNFVCELQKLLNWFQSQTQFSFIASSILLAYESETPTNGIIMDNSDYSKTTNDDVIVKFIDFTHVLSNDSNLDTNVIFGIESLINYFNRACK